MDIENCFKIFICLHFPSGSKFSKMYSGLDRKVHFSTEDLAMGAVDLAEEEDTGHNTTLAGFVNNTVLNTAVSVVKEAGPRIIEAITTHLVPVLPRSPEVIKPLLFPTVVQPPTSLTTTPHAEVVVSPPLETVVVISPVYNNTQLPPPVIHDTV
jgi:hypothetical protein